MNSDIKLAGSQDQFLSRVRRGIEAILKEAAEDGILLEMVEHCLSVPGKMTRPKAIYALSQALGYDGNGADSWAICLEILHNASLVHDDLQDGDLVRRGAPTAWSKYGSNQAINLGDLLLLLAPKALHSNQLSLENIHGLHQVFVKLSTAMVKGQCDEFCLNRLENHHQLYDLYLKSIKGKTAAFFGGLAKGVCLLAEETQEATEEMEYFFNELGIVFQMQDDILDLYGDKQRGEIGCDIKEGKVSLLVVHHLSQNPDALESMRTLLHTPRKEVAQGSVFWARQLFLDNGTLDRALGDITERIITILAWSRLDKDPALRKLIQGLITDIIRPIEHLLPTMGTELPSSY